MTDKIKRYSNPHRNETVEHKPYVPQYQVHDVEPVQYKSGLVPAEQITVARPNPLPLDNPRAKREPIRQSYGQPQVSHINDMLNVGNNVEHLWASVDGHVIDDFEDVTDKLMIDNNDELTDEALGYTAGIQVKETPKNVVYEETPYQSSEDLFPLISDLSTESFLLIVAGAPICSGPKEEIEEQARSFIFGENEMCDGNPVDIEDIIIIKKVKIKVGLFLEN
jgi:hypothetical protein